MGLLSPQVFINIKLGNQQNKLKVRVKKTVTNKKFLRNLMELGFIEGFCEDDFKKYKICVYLYVSNYLESRMS
jgi:ribosomal protein S8